MKNKLTYLLLISSIITGITNAQNSIAKIGSGYCLDFTPNIANNNYVDLGNLSAINTSDFTVEMWLNVNDCQNDPAFFSNKDWSSGNNIGLAMDVHDNGTKLRVNLKATGGTFKNLIVPIDAIGRGWFHVAATIKRTGYLKIYINGVTEDSLDISSVTGSFGTAYTYKLGQDGTGDYTSNGTHIRYDGKADEIRIWNYVLTKKQIRDNMCKKLTGNETGLYAYYNCDSVSQNNLNDLTGAHNGSWINAVTSSWKISGAPIGDKSTYTYIDDANQNITATGLPDLQNGVLKVRNVSGAFGVQIYKVNSLPNTTLNFNTPDSTYYGVFLTNVADNTVYDVGFDYTTDTAAVTDERNFKLFCRNQNSDLFWSDYYALQDTSTHILSKQGVRNRKEYILGSIQALSCAPPSLINTKNQTDSSFTIGWTSGGSSTWNTQWGIEGFQLGSGTGKVNTTTNPQTIIGIVPKYFYEFYVQDTCNGNGSSYWVGPFTFSNQTCISTTRSIVTNISSHSAVLNWNGVGVRFDIEWGLQGFTLGTGIPYTTDSILYTLTGLQSNTTYSYYVRTNCDSINTIYSGPYTFTTLGSAGINENSFANSITISPNPSDGEFIISTSVAVSKMDVSIFNLLGEKIFQTTVLNNNGKINQSFNLKTFPAGIYTIHINNGKEITARRIVIQ